VTLPTLKPGAVADLAGLIKIVDHRSGARTPWVPSVEQQAFWDATCQHKSVYVGKSRQVGISTAARFEAVCWTFLCDADGHTVRCALVLDTFEKSLEAIAACADFCAQMKLQCESFSDRIVFPNGSQIQGITAGSKTTGRSLSFQRLYMSEFAYWDSPDETYTALMNALGLSGHAVIETTMSVDKKLAKHMWQGQNEYHKLFFPVEMHEEYRADPSTITDEEWQELRAEGFTRRDAAAWWTWAKRNKCANDPIRAFREYPQRIEHMFTAAAGRYIPATPTVIPPVSHIEVTTKFGTRWKVAVWRPREETSGQCIVAVDVAKGAGGDDSVVLVLDKRDKAICAAFAANTLDTDELGQIAATVQREYTKPAVTNHTGFVLEHRVRPRLIIEGNGVGAGAIESAREYGGEPEEITTNQDSKRMGMQLVKSAILEGLLYGPQALADNCDSCVLTEKGEFKGAKDVLMTAGFALLHLQKDAYRPPDPNLVRNPDGVYADKLLARLKKNRSPIW